MLTSNSPPSQLSKRNNQRKAKQRRAWTKEPASCIRSISFARQPNLTAPHGIPIPKPTNFSANEQAKPGSTTTRSTQITAQKQSSYHMSATISQAILTFFLRFFNAWKQRTGFRVCDSSREFLTALPIVRMLGRALRWGGTSLIDRGKVLTRMIAFASKIEKDELKEKKFLVVMILGLLATWTCVRAAVDSRHTPITALSDADLVDRVWVWTWNHSRASTFHQRSFPSIITRLFLHIPHPG